MPKYKLEQNVGHLFDRYALTQFTAFQESNEYLACSFKINNRQIVYRKAKITPKKIGQFVAIWKRTPEGITAPYSDTDNIDFMIINVATPECPGMFIFPKEALKMQGILSSQNKPGKRGMRVYPPWDIAQNKQAIKTQKWQSDYFHPTLEPTLFQ